MNREKTASMKKGGGGFLTRVDGGISMEKSSDVVKIAASAGIIAAWFGFELDPEQVAAVATLAFLFLSGLRGWFERRRVGQVDGV